MNLWQNLPKTMGARTHAFKNAGCYSIHSTHTNDDPAIWRKIQFDNHEKCEGSFTNVVTPILQFFKPSFSPNHPINALMALRGIEKILVNNNLHSSSSFLITLTPLKKLLAVKNGAKPIYWSDDFSRNSISVQWYTLRDVYIYPSCIQLEAFRVRCRQLGLIWLSVAGMKLQVLGGPNGQLLGSCLS